MENQNPAIKSNSQKKNTLLAILRILSPSALGLFFYIIIFIITLAVNQPSELKTAITSFNTNDFQGTFIYRYIVDFSKLINTHLISQLAIYIFWVFVAFIIYLIASRLTKNVDELAKDFSLRQYVWPKDKDRNVPIREFAEKFVFHAVTLIILIFYLFKATPWLASLWKRSDLTLKFSVHNIWALIVLLFFEVLYLHVTIILVRLFLTKHRLITG